MAAQTETAFNDVTRSMEDALTSFVTSGKLNFKSFADSLIADIIRIQARAAISGLFSAALNAAGSYFGNGAATFAANVQGGNSLDNLVSNTGGWGTIPARASGGSVDSGTTYLVGEKGPELFVPGASGTIMPNHALSSGGASGGGLTINAPISINSSGDAEADKRNAGDLNKKITAAIQSVLVNERRQGGVLWKMKNGVA
jgi:phage-related minor tail protein